MTPVTLKILNILSEHRRIPEDEKNTHKLTSTSSFK